MITYTPKKFTINTTLTMPGNNFGLVGHWTFDGKDMINNVADSSGQGNTGYMVAAATSSQQVAGQIGQALKFNGTTQYVNVGNSSTLNPGSTISVCIWINSSDTVGADGVIMRYDNTNLSSWGLFRNNGSNKMTWYTNGSTQANTISSTAVVFDGKWHQVCGTMDSTAQTIYVDGVQSGSTSGNSSLWQTPTINVYIGSAMAGLINVTATLDDVRIYNRALSPAELLQLYQQGTGTHQNTTLNPPNLKQGLVGHWTFDGKDMIKNVADSSGQGNTGYMVAAATSSQQVAGVLGQALKFNGTTQYVKGPSNIVSSSVLTYSLWVKFNVLNSNKAIISMNTGLNDRMEKVESGTNNRLQGNASFSALTPTNSITIGPWYHVALTSDGTITTIYLDGVVGPTTGLTTFTTFSPVLAIGGRDNLLFFNGTIDDVRIYNRALSAAEVTQLYKLGR